MSEEVSFPEALGRFLGTIILWMVIGTMIIISVNRLAQAQALPIGIWESISAGFLWAQAKEIFSWGAR